MSHGHFVTPFTDCCTLGVVPAGGRALLWLQVTMKGAAMNPRIVIGTLALGTLFAAATPALADPGRGWGHGHRNHHDRVVVRHSHPVVTRTVVIREPVVVRRTVIVQRPVYHPY